MNQWLCMYILRSYYVFWLAAWLITVVFLGLLTNIKWLSESIFFQKVINIINCLLISVVIIGIVSFVAIALSCIILIVVVVIVSGEIMIATSIAIKLCGFRVKVVFLVVRELFGLGRARRWCLELWNVGCRAMVSRIMWVLLPTHCRLSLHELALEDLVLCIQWRFLLPKSSELLW